ncbi:unnamed protein product, partial [Chrysoparadoxa australica]
MDDFLGSVAETMGLVDLKELDEAMAQLYDPKAVVAVGAGPADTSQYCSSAPTPGQSPHASPRKVLAPSEANAKSLSPLRKPSSRPSMDMEVMTGGAAKHSSLS